MTQRDSSGYGDLNRRQLLQLSALGGGAILAGCSGGDDDTGDNTDTIDNTDSDTDTETDDEDPPLDNTDSNNGGTQEQEFEPMEIIQMEVGGEGFTGETDSGHFYYAEASGDFDVAVHCMDHEGSRRGETAGIMVRNSLEPDAPMAFVRRRPHPGSNRGLVTDYSDTWFSIRPSSGAETNADANGPRAEWLRMRRDGDTLETYVSLTGEEWRPFETISIPDDIDLAEDVYLGLAGESDEENDEETVRVTFKNLSGVEPTENVDIGDPDHAGSVDVREDVPYTTSLEPDRSPEELTLRGALYLPEELEEAECSFAYREYHDDDLTTTDPQTLTESGTFEETIDAESRRLYLFAAIIDVEDAPELAAARPSMGTTVYRGTPSPAGEGGSDESLSTGQSHFGLEDGFAEPAPWLDDDTPIIKITEPSREQVYDAFRVPHERLVVFETSGVINLRGEQLSIRTDKCYVAGQTAPSPGITFIGEGIQIAASDCVLQHIRCRSGDEGAAPTSLYVQDTRENNVVDHCTTTWGIDENLSIGGKTENTTYSNNLVAEALRDSNHGEGEHSMGSLILPEAENVALLGNVWAHNVNRNPRLRLASRSVVVNNLTYNYSDGCWMDPQTRASIVGNQYLRPRSEQANVMTKSLDYGEGIPKAYVADNYCDGDVPMVGEDVEELDERPLWPDGLEAMPVDDVYDHNLTNAGARPADRTHHDERIIDLVRNDEGDFIDSQEEVGGYPELEENTQTLEIPDSGTRAWLRELSQNVEIAD